LSSRPGGPAMAVRAAASLAPPSGPRRPSMYQTPSRLGLRCRYRSCSWRTASARAPSGSRQCRRWRVTRRRWGGWSSRPGAGRARPGALQADLLDAAGGHGGVGQADFACGQGPLEAGQPGELAADADQLGGGAGPQAAGGAQPGGGAEGAGGGGPLAGDDGVEDVPEPEQLLDPLALGEAGQGGPIIGGDLGEGVGEAVEGGGEECC